MRQNVLLSLAVLALPFRGEEPPKPKPTAVAQSGTTTANISTASIGSKPEVLPKRLQPPKAFDAIHAKVLKGISGCSVGFDRVKPDFSSLDDGFHKARIVGIGQQTHGSREIFKVQLDIFKYLVEKHGFRTLLWEESYGPIAIVNDFIQGRTASIKSVAGGLMRCWRVEEVGDCFKWMNDWNVKHPGDKLDIIGVDVQRVNDKTFNDILLFLPVEDRQHWLSVIEKIKIMGDSVNVDDVNVAISYAGDLLRRVELVSCAKRDSDWTGATLAVRSIIEKLKSSVSSIRSDISKLGTNYLTVVPPGLLDLDRDFGMAKNISMLMSAFPKRKFAFFAHSLHVAKEPNIGGGCATGAMISLALNNVALPEYRDQFGYYVVAVGTRRGTVLAQSASANYEEKSMVYRVNKLVDAVPYSLEGLLGEVGKGKDLLVNMAKSNGWLNTIMPHYFTGADMVVDNESSKKFDISYNYYFGAPAKEYDAYILLDKTEATTILDEF